MAFRRTGVFAFLILAILFVFSVYGQHGGGQPPQGPYGGGAPMAPPPPEEVRVPDKGVSLPLLEFDGRAVVDVKINGKGPYRFVLGTTANLTLIDSGLQKELNLPQAEGMTAGPSGGNTPTIVTVGELRLGDAAIRGFIGAVMPLAQLWGTGPNAPRGIVSANLFSGYLLTYDYPKKRLLLQKGELPKDDSITTFSYSESRPTVPLRVGGKTIRVQVDPGSNAGLMFANKYEKEMALGGPAQDVGKTRTTAGEFPVTKGAISSPVELGKYKLPLTEVSFSDARGQVAGTVGNSVLRNFVVTLDVWNHLVRFSQ